jgi:hypothetical protein
MTKRHDSYLYDLEYESSPEQKKRRARRNRDRRRAISEGKVKKGSHMDIHHRNKDDLDDIMLLHRSKNRSRK